VVENRRSGGALVVEKKEVVVVGRWRQGEVLGPPGLSFSPETRCGGCQETGGGRKPAGWVVLVFEKGRYGGGWVDSGTGRD
jgi:hypothetical protein